MKTYEVRYTAEAKKALKKLDKVVYMRVMKVIDGLEIQPRPAGVKKLVARAGWRIRVGDYRVVYTIEDSLLVVSIIRVAHRRDAYR